MNREHVTSQQIRFLLTLWETKSLTATAQKLGISKATATRFMTSVRTLFHDPLFIRSSEGLVPTARMTELEPRLSELALGLINVVRPPTFDPANVEFTIRTAGVDNAAFAFLLPCLKMIFTKAPRMRLSFVPLTDDFLTRLEFGKIDVAFYAPPMTLPPNFHEADLFASEHVIVVRSGHPLCDLWEERIAQDDTLYEEDLAPYRKIDITYGALDGRSNLQDAYGLERENTAVDSGFFLSSAFFLLETDFYARLPVFTARYLARYLPLKILPRSIGPELPVWKARLIWHNRTDRDPAMQWFRSGLIGMLCASHGLMPNDSASS